jgi:hypothetical protein
MSAYIVGLLFWSASTHMFITTLFPLLADGWSRAQRRYIVMGKFLALPLRIRKVLSSYLDRTTSYPEKHVVLPPCSRTEMPSYRIKICHENLHVLLINPALVWWVIFTALVWWGMTNPMSFFAYEMILMWIILKIWIQIPYNMDTFLCQSFIKL